MGLFGCMLRQSWAAYLVALVGVFVLLVPIELSCQRHHAQNLTAEALSHADADLHQVSSQICSASDHDFNHAWHCASDDSIYGAPDANMSVQIPKFVLLPMALSDIFGDELKLRRRSLVFQDSDDRARSGNSLSLRFLPETVVLI